MCCGPRLLPAALNFKRYAPGRMKNNWFFYDAKTQWKPVIRDSENSDNIENGYEQ